MSEKKWPNRFWIWLNSKGISVSPIEDRMHDTEYLARAEHEATLSQLRAENEKYRKALEFYALGEHFEYCGLDDHEPETVSGEPENWLCGGAEGSEFQYEDGYVARFALSSPAPKGESDE